MIYGGRKIGKRVQEMLFKCVKKNNKKVKEIIVEFEVEIEVVNECMVEGVGLMFVKRGSKDVVKENKTKWMMYYLECKNRVKWKQ